MKNDCKNFNQAFGIFELHASVARQHRLGELRVLVRHRHRRQRRSGRLTTSSYSLLKKIYFTVEMSIKI